MKKIGLLSLAATTVLMAGGYKVPYVSMDAVALGAANIAHASGADAAYYNPANMIWGTDGAAMEVGLTYIDLSEIKFDGTAANILGTTTTDNIQSKSENVLIPNIHYVSPKVGDMTFGLSITSPAGLTKRWDDQPAASWAEEFSLKTVEVNPTAAYKANDMLAMAFGLRIVYSEGVAKAGMTHPLDPTVVVYQDMEGDGLDFGYNIALSYRPNATLELGVTYRSKVDLDVEGDAKMTATPYGLPTTATDAKVSLPVPAALNVGVAYTFETKTTVEVVWERTYWGDYESLHFEFEDTNVDNIFGTPGTKNWDDSNSYRIGVTQEYNKFTAMAGLVYDETPMPDSTINFENPDSDSMSYSIGGRYEVDEQWNVGLAALYNTKKDRTITAADNNVKGIDGEFSDSKVYIISAAVEYKF